MAGGVGPLSLDPELEPGALAEKIGLDNVAGRVQPDRGGEMPEVTCCRIGVGVLIAVDKCPAGGPGPGLESVKALIQSGADLRRWGGRDYPGRRGFLRGSRGLRGRRRSRGLCRTLAGVGKYKG